MTTVKLKMYEPGGGGEIVAITNATRDSHGWHGIDPYDDEHRFYPVGTWTEIKTNTKSETGANFVNR